MNAAPRDSDSKTRGDHSARVTAVRQPKFEGRVLGGFRLAREIAAGGMAAVYLAHRAQHARVGQTAAVKVIHPHLARDEDFIEMFLDEARIASCITHPNVCRVLDFGMADGTYYLAMEYVMGETLAELLTRLGDAKDGHKVEGPLLAQIIAQACEGLHAAHEACDAQGKPLNIVHRDISPQNIMVGYDGSVRLLDFGVASASERLHSTRHGKIKGRLAYMAPEQMRGLPTDRRADLWSIGVVLWEGLSGQRLFKRDDEIKTMLAVTREPLTSLADCGRNIPVSLQRIVARTLKRDRESRFATARELGLALSRSAIESYPRVGMPEISGWMQSLFADRIEQKRALLRDAADAAAKPVSAATKPASAVVSRVVEKRAQPEASETRVSVPLRTPKPSRPERRSLPKKNRLGQRALMTVVTMLVLALPATGSAPGAEHLQKYARAWQELSSRAASGAKAEQRAPVKLKDDAVRAPATPAALSAARPAVQGAPVPASALPPKRTLEATHKLEVGIVNIVTTGGRAEVYLGARRLGVTPLRVWLPIGTHSVRLAPFGNGPTLVRSVAVGTEEAGAQLTVALNQR